MSKKRTWGPVISESDIYEADRLVIQNIFLDWGYQKGRYWMEVDGVVEIQKEDGRVRTFAAMPSVTSLHPSIGQLKALEELDLSETALINFQQRLETFVI